MLIAISGRAGLPQATTDAPDGMRQARRHKGAAAAAPKKFVGTQFKLRPGRHTADTSSHTNSNLRQGSTHRTAPWAMGQEQHNVSKHSLGSQPDSAAGASTAQWTDHQHTHPQQACHGAPKHTCTHNSHTLCAQTAYQQQDHQSSRSTAAHRHGGSYAGMGAGQGNGRQQPAGQPC
jgi:hypothetical protein